MPDIVLIGCTKRKLDRPAPARELYVGRLFKASVVYAEARGLPWAVLSAEFGVVQPDDVLPPYDKTLRGIDTKAWGELVVRSGSDVKDDAPVTCCRCLEPQTRRARAA